MAGPKSCQCKPLPPQVCPVPGQRFWQFPKLLQVTQNHFKRRDDSQGECGDRYRHKCLFRPIQAPTNTSKPDFPPSRQIYARLSQVFFSPSIETMPSTEDPFNQSQLQWVCMWRYLAQAPHQSSIYPHQRLTTESSKLHLPGRYKDKTWWSTMSALFRTILILSSWPWRPCTSIMCFHPQ